MGWNLPEQVRLQALSGEQQSKWTQSGSSSRSARNRGAAGVKPEQQLNLQSRSNSGGRNRGAVEMDAIGEQQLKQTQVASSS